MGHMNSWAPGTLPLSCFVCVWMCSCSLYAKYYFELRTLREGEAFPLQPLKHEQLRRLEARSAAFNAEILSAREKEKALDRGARTLGSLKSGY